MALMKFLTQKELAQRLRCSEAAIRVWRRKGLPTLRFGRLVRFSLEAALSWFQSQQQQELSGE
jgi:excisionase family DNA binding protein